MGTLQCERVEKAFVILFSSEIWADCLLLLKTYKVLRLNITDWVWRLAGRGQRQIFLIYLCCSFPCLQSFWISKSDLLLVSRESRILFSWSILFIPNFLKVQLRLFILSLLAFSCIIESSNIEEWLLLQVNNLGEGFFRIFSFIFFSSA